MNENAKVFDQIVQDRRAIRKFDTSFDFDPMVVTRSIERATLTANSSNLQLWEFYRIKSQENKALFNDICLGQNAAKTSNEIIVFVARPDLWRPRAAFNIEAHKNLFYQKNGEQTITDKQKNILKYWEKHIPFEFTSRLGLMDLYKRILVFFVGLKKPIKRDLTRKGNFISAHKTVSLAAQTFMLSIAAEGYDTCPMEGFDSKRVKKLLKLPHGADITMLVAVGKRAHNGVYTPRFRVPLEEVYFEL